MTISSASIEWALDFMQAHSDGDLFPRVLEVEAIAAVKADFIAQIAGADLGNLPPGSCRRFIVPKDEISYRQATQLDPQDSIILTALVYEYGPKIEALRQPRSRVFSYRFAPTAADGLYSGKNAWNNFWRTAAQLGRRSHQILYCDIADFYNQVSHHTVENQLIAAGLPNQARKWVVGLLESTTAGVSRGVPVGPHAVHLIAEASLAPVDNSLVAAGIRFVRYGDDIVVVCRSDRERRTALSTIATVLDRQQRLTLQRHKTKFYDAEGFRSLCAKMIEDRPISAGEDSLLKLINKYAGGNPYKGISYEQVAPADWSSISARSIASVVEEYIAADQVDYIRLRWFYRRLAQIGHPGAIDVSLDNLEHLGPCFANICLYLASVQSVPAADWKRIGARLIQIMKSPEVQANEYFRLSILSLFTRSASINHFAKLRALFQQGDPFVRREIVLAARINGSLDWIRELKESYAGMDPWQQRAMLFAVAGLPNDEKRYFVGRHIFSRPFEKALAKWAKSA